MAKRITTAPTTATTPAPPARGMARGAARTERYTPETAADGTTEVLPRVPPTAPFLFAWNPVRWVVLEGQVVPSLRKVPLQPGVNRVQRTKAGKYRLGEMRAHLEERGWTLLPYAKGPGGASYIHRARTAIGPEGAYAHLSLWESVYPGSDQIGSDTAGYAAWVAGLVADGTIPPCPPYLADRLRDQHRATLASYEEKITRGGVSYEPAAKRLRADIDALDGYLDGELADATPAATEPASVEID